MTHHFPYFKSLSTSLGNIAALPRYHRHLNPCDYMLIPPNATKTLRTIYSVSKSQLLYTSVSTHYQPCEDNEGAYSAFIRKDVVDMEATCVRRTVTATAASSCGRCASLCAWWLCQWSWSAHPELHPAVPAPSLPPGRGSSAASASV